MTPDRRQVHVVTLLAGFILFAGVAVAGKAHFVGTPVLQVSGDTVTASGKVAGLGNVPQIHVVLSGDAACINPGGNDPEAENKETFSAEGDFPVQNGRAHFSLDLEATFQPRCNPPMSVAWSNVEVVVTADDGTRLVFP
jgi:hypothetical protein